LLIGSPHSVAYGALESFWLRKFEINHLDLYLTWGWKSDCSNVIDFYWPNNSGRKEEFNYNNSNEQRKKILLTTAARPKHTLEYPYHVSIYEKYLQEQIELIKRINSDLSHKVYVRTRDKTTGWGIVNLYAKSQLNVTVEKQSGSFTRILNNFEIHISDNCSTAYLESIAANWPTLIVNSSSYFIFSDQGNEYYLGLKQVGIYHESIDSLINHLRSINNNIKGWWFSEEVQKSINTFMYTQGRHTQSTTEWLEKLL
jgi:putative transferase (TIGR04331 family)